MPSVKTVTLGLSDKQKQGQNTGKKKNNRVAQKKNFATTKTYPGPGASLRRSWVACNDAPGKGEGLLISSACSCGRSDGGPGATRRFHCNFSFKKSATLPQTPLLATVALRSASADLTTTNRIPSILAGEKHGGQRHGGMATAAAFCSTIAASLARGTTVDPAPPHQRRSP